MHNTAPSLWGEKKKGGGEWGGIYALLNNLIERICLKKKKIPSQKQTMGISFTQLKIKNQISWKATFYLEKVFNIFPILWNQL